jgi:flagellar hook assembly protein FlgD
VKVFNVLGEEVRTLVDGHQKANTYQVTWDGKDADGKSVASGVYFCTLKAGEFSQTAKMVFMK